MSEGIAVAVPGMGPPTWGLVRSLMELRAPEGDDWTFLNVTGRPVEDARNELVRLFLQTGRQWLLFLDADALLPRGALIRLLSWQAPVVGALAFTRYAPPMPTVYAGHSGQWANKLHPRYAIQVEETLRWLQAHPGLLQRECGILDPAPEDSLRRVDFTGCHCLLIQREVLTALKPPWFRRFEADGRTQPTGVGEDYRFCQRVNALRVPIFVDRSLIVGHVWGEQALAGLDFMAWAAITDMVSGGYTV